jgi:L-fucose isomerase-like protein
MTKIKVRIGFVPSYRFGDMAWCEKLRTDCLAMFAGVAGMEVVVPQPSPNGETVDADLGLTPHGMVRTLQEGEAVAAYFRKQEVDGIVLCPLDFGDERSAVKVAEMLKVPVLLFATKEPAALAGPAMARASDSYCGNLSMASGLYRRKIPFRFAGIFFPAEPELQQEVQDFVRAVAVVKRLRGAHIGQVGVRPAPFETVGYDETALIRHFSQNVIHTDLADITIRAEGFRQDDPRLLAIREDLHRCVQTITVSADYLEKEARLELALRDFWEANRLSAMAMACWPSIQKMMGISVCALYGRLTEAGMLTACETDVLGALAMLVNYAAALGETIPHFVDWTIQHRQNANRLLAWHCGNAPVSLARDPAGVALRSRRNMTAELPIVEHDEMAGLYQFQLKPGPVTFCRLAEYDDRWKMLIARGEIIPSDETLSGTWSWVEVPDHPRLYRTLVEEGFIHHASMIHGDQVKALLQVCKFMDIQPVEVV